jgi:hypothetical protein
MQVYLVRHIESREFQGIFWAQSLAELWDLFDEIGDPLGFEFARIKSGALYHQKTVGEGPVIGQWGEMTQAECNQDFDWGIFEESEGLAESLRDQRRLRFKPFDASDEGVGLVARIARKVLPKADVIPIRRR